MLCTPVGEQPFIMSALIPIIGQNFKYLPELRFIDVLELPTDGRLDLRLGILIHFGQCSKGQSID